MCLLPAWRFQDRKYSNIWKAFNDRSIFDPVYDLILVDQWILVKIIAETWDIQGILVYNSWAIGYAEAVSQVGKKKKNVWTPTRNENEWTPPN